MLDAKKTYLVRAIVLGLFTASIGIGGWIVIGKITTTDVKGSFSFSYRTSSPNEDVVKMNTRGSDKRVSNQLINSAQTEEDFGKAIGKLNLQYLHKSVEVLTRELDSATDLEILEKNSQKLGELDEVVLKLAEKITNDGEIVRESRDLGKAIRKLNLQYLHKSVEVLTRELNSATDSKVIERASKKLGDLAEVVDKLESREWQEEFEDSFANRVVQLILTMVLVLLTVGLGYVLIMYCIFSIRDSWNES